MSRSRKKVPSWSSKYSKSWSKRQANKKARKEDLDSGNYYKRVYNSYDINDFRGIFWRDNREKNYKDWIK